MEDAFAHAALAMYNYMTPLSGISIDHGCSRHASNMCPARCFIFRAFQRHFVAAPFSVLGCCSEIDTSGQPSRALLLAAQIWTARRTFEASGHDAHSLLYNFLDELLYVFSTELLVCRQIAVETIDRKSWKLFAQG